MSQIQDQPNQPSTPNLLPYTPDPPSRTDSTASNPPKVDRWYHRLVNNPIFDLFTPLILLFIFFTGPNTAETDPSPWVIFFAVVAVFILIHVVIYWIWPRFVVGRRTQQEGGESFEDVETGMEGEKEGFVDGDEKGGSGGV